MHEIELKFQVPAGRRKAVDADVAGRTPTRRQRLQAAYVDTPGRALAKAGIALRVRREGRVWVQTVKGAAADGLARPEHNVARGSAAEPPMADPALHAGTAIGERLRAVLDAHPGEPLAVLYRTDILRRTRSLPTPKGVVELAFDDGAIIAGNEHVPVSELEIELKSGAAAAVLDVARLWLPRHGLWLDTRSKAERGDLLARGERRAPPRMAHEVELHKHMSAGEAWLAVLRSCAEQITVNAAQVASGDHDDEHVHQLRVGLRRLRSGLRFFEGLNGDPAWDEAAAALFRRLGGARDGAVVDAEFSAELQAALQSTGHDAGAPITAALPGTEAPSQMLRDVDAQSFLLDLIAATSADAALSAEGSTEAHEPGDAVPLRDELARRVKRWHRRAARDARQFAELDVDARHALRKKIKRLRYALEFSASLFPKGAVRRYLRPLKALQERLGEINDVAVAMTAYAAARDTEPRAWFALGWLASRRDALVKDAGAELKAFAKARPFWK